MKTTTVTARWVQWGKGRFHVQEDGSDVTACGKDVPDEVRVAIYSPMACSRCAKHTTLADAADRERKERYREHEQLMNESVERNRRGEFVVYRCRLCGTQHAAPSRGPGVNYCFQQGHMADLEAVLAHGEPWSEAAASQGSGAPE